MSSSSAFAPPPDHHYCFSPSEQLCYVGCNFCDTVLAVSVPCTSFFKTVTVRCGHCTNLLSVNMRGPLLPPGAANHHQLHLGHTFFSPHNLLDEIRSSSTSNLLMSNPNESLMIPPVRGIDELPKIQPAANRPPEKRQRVPSAYNRFIKEEIQRIKSENPDISHREAFSTAAKNWAHFPHIHFGLMPPHQDHHQPMKNPNLCQQEGDHDVMMKEGFLAPPNIGVAPY